MKSLMILLILLIAAPLPAATVYRWTDEKGVRQETSNPPAGPFDYTIINTKDPPTREEIRREEIRLERAEIEADFRRKMREVDESQEKARARYKQDLKEADIEYVKARIRHTEDDKERREMRHRLYELERQ